MRTADDLALDLVLRGILRPPCRTKRLGGESHDPALVTSNRISARRLSSDAQVLQWVSAERTCTEKHIDLIAKR